MSPQGPFDCLIIGAGPAGLTAATYLGRFRRKVMIVDAGESRAAWIPKTHNLIGYTEGISGPALLDRMRAQAREFGIEVIGGTVADVSLQADDTFAAVVESDRFE